MAKKMSIEERNAEQAIKKSKSLRDAEAKRLKSDLAEIEKNIKSEQERKERISDSAFQLKELAGKLQASEKEIAAGRSAGTFCMLVIKQAIVLEIEEIKAVIEEARGKLANLQQCLKLVPEANELGNAVNDYNCFGVATCKKCEELIKNVRNISTVDGVTLLNNIKYIIGRISETLKNKSKFGYDLLAAVNENEVIIYSEQAKALFGELKNRMCALSDVLTNKSVDLAETPNEYDDNLIVLYQALGNYADDFIEELENTAMADIASSKLELTRIGQELKDNYAYVEKTKKIIDAICIQYIDLLTYIDAQEKAFVSYLSDADNNKLSDLMYEYERKIFDLVKRIGNGISLKANDENDIKHTYTYYVSALTLMTELYNKAKEQYEQCRNGLVEALKNDAKKIGSAYSRVKPNVPQYATPTVEVYVLHVDPMQKSLFHRVKSQALNQSGIAALSLSTICCKYNEIGVESRIKAKKLKLLSLAAFKELGLISEGTKSVYIVDDGYIDPDKTFAKTDFSAEDNGMMFISEVVARKFLYMLK